MKKFSKAVKPALKLIKCISGILWWVIVLATAFLLVSIVSAKMKGEVPNIFGYSVMRIVSGSMEPEIPSGAYILVKKIAPEDVKTGDIISFYSEDKAIYGMPNTHRVTEIEALGNGTWLYTTKGDANIIADKIQANSGKLIGVYDGQIGWLNDLENALSGNLMLLLIIALQALIIVFAGFSFIHSLKNAKTDAEQNEEQNKE